MTAAAQQARFSILFVCTGNICRSPYAELLTRHLLDQRLPRTNAVRFTVRSAGTAALTGSEMEPMTSSLIQEWGVPRTAGQEHVARQIDEPTISRADLVLTAERHHRAHVATLCPGARSRCFTLREFNRLLNQVEPGPPADDPVEIARAGVVAAAGRRGMTPPVAASEDAIADPFRRTPEFHRATTTMLDTLVANVVRMLTARGVCPGV
ncbi:MAG: hypothetical protein ABW224_12130 [Kibdelosporangium sp.]